MEIKDRVKMTEEFKKEGSNGPNVDHIIEFGEQEGEIIGYPFEDDKLTVDVRWDSGFRYMYGVNHLSKI